MTEDDFATEKAALELMHKHQAHLLTPEQIMLVSTPMHIRRIGRVSSTELRQMNAGQIQAFFTDEGDTYLRSIQMLFLDGGEIEKLSKNPAYGPIVHYLNDCRTNSSVRIAHDTMLMAVERSIRSALERS